DLNPWNEKWLVVKNLFTVTPVRLEYKGRHYRYDSLLFSNIGQMSKVLKLNHSAQPDDGLFEITSKKSGNIIGLLRQLFKAATIGLAGTKQTRQVCFTMLADAKIQLD